MVMKSKAYGWLAAAALAAGLNASYHDGGLRWAHQVVDEVGHNSAAVLALAAGHAGQFLAEARLVSNQVAADEMADQVASDRMELKRVAARRTEESRMVAERDNRSCPWAAAVARWRSKVVRVQADSARVEAMSDQEQARQQAALDRVQARQQRMQAQIVAETDRLRAAATAFSPAVLRSVAFNPATVKTVELRSQCEVLRQLRLERASLPSQTIRVSLPQLPRIDVPKFDMPQISVPEVYVDAPSADPI
jgi:hypothetical protein